MASPSIQDPTKLPSPGESAVRTGGGNNNGLAATSSILSASKLPSAPAADGLHEIIAKMVHPRGAALDMGPMDSPCYGQARALGRLDLPLRYGDFKVYAFQTDAAGGHVVALTLGDCSTKDPLLTRIHSECITSEGLGGCDCDCVEQLNASLEKISKEGRGVVFYLRQEGRGAGLDAKARDRMGVAASDNILNTFHLYQGLGLGHDPRDYGVLNDCAYLLGISADLRLMTNNPGKLGAFRERGLNIRDHVPLQMRPNPFNSAYLSAKFKSGGHILSEHDVGNSLFPWKVEPFKPHLLPDASRFSHEASYPFPVRSFKGEYILTESAHFDLTEALKTANKSEMLLSVEPLPHNRVRAVINQDFVLTMAATGEPAEVCRILHEATCWFEAHVYNDTNTNLNYVALQFGERNPPKSRDEIVPLIRIQPESILRRLPLRDRSEALEKSYARIVERGRGMVVTYPEDGRGNGFSSAFMDLVMVQRGDVKNASEAANVRGVRPDSRDYLPIARLLRHHYGKGPIQLILREENKPNKPVTGLIEELQASGMVLHPPQFLEPGRVS